MAFLDNSGDIILDAVLTDLGRRRMSRGNFRIVKFALGDEEVNYELFDSATFLIHNGDSKSIYKFLEIVVPAHLVGWIKIILSNILM